MLREIVVIDEEKCDGCGLCVPACQEGALQVVNGKVKLIRDKLCDGLGACLGECPQGALRIEKRESEEFDEEAVAVHLGRISKGYGGDGTGMGPMPIEPRHSYGSCPSSQFVRFEKGRRPAGPTPTHGTVLDNDELSSELTHWPVQLRLLSPTAPVLRGARLLLSADCVPVAFPGFHQKLLRGRTVAVACPKLDDPRGYLEKLTEMIRTNDLKDITVAHMQVPCCSGLLRMALAARRASGADIPVIEVVIGVQGEILTRSEVTDEVDWSRRPPKSASCPHS